MRGCSDAAKFSYRTTHAGEDRRAVRSMARPSPRQRSDEARARVSKLRVIRGRTWCVIPIFRLDGVRRSATINTCRLIDSRATAVAAGILMNVPCGPPNECIFFVSQDGKFDYRE